MKILCVGTERNDAQAIAGALRGMDEVVSVSWAARLDHLVTWLDQNRDLAALIVESHDHESLAQVRALGWQPPIVVIVPDGTEPDSEVHCSIQRNQSLLRDLPVVVTRAIERTAQQDLRQQLARATAALQNAEQRHQAAERQLAEIRSQCDIGMARAAATWEMVDEQLRTAALEVEQARQDQATAVAERDRLLRQLAEAGAAVDAANARVDDERRAAAGQLADQQREFQSQIAHEADRRRNLEELLEEAVGALDEAEQHHISEINIASAQTRELEATLLAAREDLESRVADIAGLAAREEETNARLNEAIDSRSDVERRLAATEAAFDEAVTRATRDRLAASKKAAEREAELDGQLRKESTTRAALEQAVADGETALADRGRELTQTVADRDRLSQQLSNTDDALAQARRDHEAAAADVERLTEREAALTSQLADSEAAQRETQRQHEAALAASAADLIERQADFEREITQIVADRDRLTQQLSDTDDALSQARRDYEAATADIQRLTERGAELTSQLADAAATQLETQRQHEAALASSAATLAERQADFDRELTQGVAHRDRLTQRLSDTDDALAQARRDHEAATANIQRLMEREAELTSQLADAAATQLETQRQHEAALAASAATLAERQAEFDRELTQTVADRDRLSQQLVDTDATLAQVRRDHEAATANIQRLMEREAELTSQLADAAATQLETQRQHEAVMAASAADLAERQAAFDRELTQGVAERDRLAQRLSDSDDALAQARRDHEGAANDVERLTDREAELTSQLSNVESAHRDTQRQHEAALAASAADLAERQADFDRQLSESADTRDRLTQRLSGVSGDLRDVCSAYEFASTDIEQLTQREAELTSQLADAEAAARDAQERHDAALAAAASEFAEHQSHLDRELSQAAAERDALRKSLADEQERVQQLQLDLTASVEAFEASRAESHRLFEHAGLPMFRCTRDGALIDANRACTTLIGRRAFDELRAAQFPAGIFDAPNALFWLIERCLNTRVKETVEASWRRHDGGRLFVRLSARLSGPDVIEFVAEDLTRLRILEERLSQAHRMEAVGRLASEVAVTCRTLLDDIHHTGRNWLATTGVPAGIRQRGEGLLEDITRAASLMEELAACGDEQQTRTPMLVDLNTLIRDLEPVLKRVAGDEVDVQLHDDSSPLNVDVGTERVERLLVNLASYGRERMPFGGRLRIELGQSVVDRRFAAKHPNVRLGLHALITVTEVRRSGTDRRPQPRAGRSGVDFGTLQGLVSECGGHLWMKIHPPGEMVAKIRLPLSIPRQQAPARAHSRMTRERMPARWFQS